MKSDFNRRINRNRLLAEMQLPRKIPALATGTYHGIPVYSDVGIKEPWSRVTITLASGMGSSHRLFVACPCGLQMPVGRYHQHAPACESSIPCNPLALFERIDSLRSWNLSLSWEEIASRTGILGIDGRADGFRTEEIWEFVSRMSEYVKDSLRQDLISWEEALRS